MWIGLAVWTLSFQLQEIILMWLYQRSGSVWVARLTHAETTWSSS
ncbi:hypothetical protein [Streptomyces sp. CA2R101]